MFFVGVASKIFRESLHFGDTLMSIDDGMTSSMLEDTICGLFPILPEFLLNWERFYPACHWAFQKCSAYNSKHVPPDHGPQRNFTAGGFTSLAAYKAEA
ncbi:MAG TPA: hypothetical protein DDZ40_00230 [Deltaproteobacteria bacterium]|nr:hypothetical protein [Deltaproteobacteria bacterium]